MTRQTTSGPKSAPRKKGSKQPNQKVVFIPNDPEQAEAYEDAKEVLDKLEGRIKARPENKLMLAQRDQLWEELDQAEEALRTNSVKYVLRAIGHKRYDELVNEHPFDADHGGKEVEEAGGDITKFPWNPETFPMALVARSLVDEANEFKDEQEILDWLNSEDWNSAEINALFNAAILANTTRSVVQLGNGSRPTRN